MTQCHDGGRVLPEELRYLLLPGCRNDLVQRVVRSDDALQPVLIVDDGHRQQVVLGDDMRHIVLTVADVDGHHPVVHEVGDGRMRFGQDQIAQREDAHERAALVRDVDIVDRFGLGRFFAQQSNGLFGSEIGPHHDVLVVIRPPAVSMG